MSAQFKGQIGHPEFGFGFIADPPERQTYPSFKHHIASRLLAAGPIPDGDIDRFAPPVYNQGATGSCGGHGTAGAVTTTFAAKGQPLKSPASPRLLYTLARATDRTDPKTPLRDTGTSPSALVRAIGTWGVATEDEIEGRSAVDADYSLYLAEHINDEPKLDELQAAHGRPNTGFTGIWEEGTAKRDAIRAAIADGYAVMAAVEAGSAAFQNYDPAKGPLDFTGSNPDHWVYFTRTLTVDGKCRIYMRNSWGLGLWTPDGCAWCSEDFIIRGMFFPIIANLGL